MNGVSVPVGVLGWVLGVSLCLLGLRYLHRRFADSLDEMGSRPSVTPYRVGSRSGDAPGNARRGNGDPTSPVVCDACGAENDRGYVFCRDCASRLAPRGGPSPYRR